MCRSTEHVQVYRACAGKTKQKWIKIIQGKQEPGVQRGIFTLAVAWDVQPGKAMHTKHYNYYSPQFK